MMRSNFDPVDDQPIRSNFDPVDQNRAKTEAPAEACNATKPYEYTNVYHTAVKQLSLTVETLKGPVAIFREGNIV